jgi:hypothetical protein
MLWEFAQTHSALSISKYMPNTDFDRKIDNDEYVEGGEIYVYVRGLI